MSKYLCGFDRNKQRIVRQVQRNNPKNKVAACKEIQQLYGYSLKDSLAMINRYWESSLGDLI